MVNARPRLATLNHKEASQNVKSTFQILSVIILASLLVFIGYLWGRQPHKPGGVSMKESVPVGFSGSHGMDFSKDYHPCSGTCEFRAELVEWPDAENHGSCNGSDKRYSNCILITNAPVVKENCVANFCDETGDVVLEWNTPPPSRS
jgi:hypothetical protein